MSLVRDAASNALGGELLGGLLDVQVKIKKHQKKKEQGEETNFSGAAGIGDFSSFLPRGGRGNSFLFFSFVCSFPHGAADAWRGR